MVRRAVLVLLCLAAVGSAGMGVHNALVNSQDFQWSPARLVTHGINPYTAALAGSPDVILTQYPNYLPLLYLLLAPLGALPFGAAKIVWAIVNVSLAVAAALIVARSARLSAEHAVVLVALMVMATPTRIAIGNGQQALLVLVVALLSTHMTSTGGAGGLLAVALTKYSFAPLAVVEVVRGRWRVVAVAAGVLAVGLIALGALTATSPATVAVQPFLVSRATVGFGVGDLMTITDELLGAPGSVAGYVIALAGCIALTRVAEPALRGSDRLAALACGSIIALVCFKHLRYDLVFLLPALVVGWSSRGWARVIVLAVVGYFWFATRIADVVGIPLDGPSFAVVSFVMLVAVLVAVLHAVPEASPARWVSVRSAR
jgi:hypothetical protein